MRKGTKREAIVDYLGKLVRSNDVGERVASVQSLMEEFDVGIATVVKSVQIARNSGVPLRSVRGPSGGYFSITKAELEADLAAERDEDEPKDELEAVLARVKSLRAELADLEARAAQLAAERES